MLHSDLCAFIPKETPVTPAVKSCAGCWGSYSVSPSAFPSVPQSVSAECPRTQPSVSSQAATPHPVVSDSIYRLPTPAVFRNTADLSPELQNRHLLLDVLQNLTGSACPTPAPNLHQTCPSPSFPVSGDGNFILLIRLKTSKSSITLPSVTYHIQVTNKTAVPFLRG